MLSVFILILVTFVVILLYAFAICVSFVYFKYYYLGLIKFYLS